MAVVRSVFFVQCICTWMYSILACKHVRRCIFVGVKWVFAFKWTSKWMTTTGLCLIERNYEKCLVCWDHFQINTEYILFHTKYIKRQGGQCYCYSSNVKKIKLQMKNTKNVEVRRYSKLIVALNWNRTALKRKYLCQTQICLAVKRNS